MLDKRAILVTLRIKMWQATQLDLKASDEVSDRHGSNPASVRVRKRLVNSSELNRVRSVAAMARLDHAEMSLPWGDGQLRILPTVSYRGYCEKMTSYRCRFAEAVDAFMDSYDIAVKQAARELGTLFEAGDYPTKDEIRERFEFHIGFMPVPTSNDFRCVLTEDDVAELRQEWDIEQAERQARLDGELWQRLIDALKEFAERADSGSPRTVEAFVRKLDGLASLATVTEQHEILEELIGTLRTEYGSEPKEGAGDQAAALASALTSYFGDVA